MKNNITNKKYIIKRNKLFNNAWYYVKNNYCEKFYLYILETID